ASLALDRHARTRAHFVEDTGVARDLADDVHGTRRAALAVAAHRCRTEEDTERAPRRPVREVADVDDFARRLGGHRQPDVEVDLVAPRLAAPFDRQLGP